MSRLPTSLFLFFSCMGMGCAPPPYAIIDGKIVPRTELGYTDRSYFAVKHANAYPEQRGPSSGLRAYGGSIVGRVCGVDVVYETEHNGRHLDVRGFVAPADQIDGSAKQPELIAYIRVQDRWSLDGGIRDFTGAVGLNAVGSDDLRNRSPTVDFAVSPSLLRGRIGIRFYNLRARDDSYVGAVNIAGSVYPFELKGRSRLWSMPAADQAAVLPLMMSCTHTERPDLSNPVLSLDLGPDRQSQQFPPAH